MEFSTARVSKGRTENLRHFLKQETARTHDRLDSIFATYALEDRAGYTDFGAAHLIAWRAVQPTWTAALRDMLGLAAPDYPAMLEADLCEVAGTDAIDLPQLPFAPPSSAAGLIYVLAGSRLGMTAIARQPNWGHINGRATRFMDDAQGPAIFRALLAHFDSPEGQLLDREQALATALETFAVFERAARIVKAPAA